MSKPRPGRLGKYQLGELIGEGAMGSVYRAQDPALDREVAIKLMKQAFGTDEHLRDRFEREARAAAGLQHPNIVTIHDFGEAKGHLYIVMEYVTGTDLAQIIRDSTPLSLDARLNIIIGVLQGLGYAHSKGIVHRDVKPANIRVLEDGRPKIMDFGIAHLTGSEITNSGIVLGTPDYMAPEQVQGLPVTPATDIFAVGSVLYELLTYQKPFKGENVHAVLHKVVTAEPAPLQHSDSSVPVPDELQSTISGALAKDVASRFASADAMIEALQAARRALGEQDTQATLPLMPGLVVPTRRRRLWVAASAVGLVAAGVAAFTVAASHPDPAAVIKLPVRVESTATGSSSAVSYRAVSESAFAPLRRAALNERARAGLAGVSRTKLARGDSLAREAEGLAALGRQSEAVERLALATANWQSARADVKPKVIKPIGVNEAVQGTVARLAQAVGSRDVEAIRRVYPNLTSEVHDKFVQFFQSTDSIIPALRVDSLETRGKRANVVIRGTYQSFPVNSTQRKRENVEYHATFEETPAGWRLTMIRKGLFGK